MFDRIKTFRIVFDENEEVVSPSNDDPNGKFAQNIFQIIFTSIKKYISSQIIMIKLQGIDLRIFNIDWFEWIIALTFGKSLEVSSFSEVFYDCYHNLDK